MLEICDFIVLYNLLSATGSKFTMTWNFDMQNKKLIVFDMDGVIIDVSNSYRDVVSQTTQTVFRSGEVIGTVAGAPLRAVRSCCGKAERWVEQ